MSDRKNAFKAGASKFEDLKRPKKLIDVSATKFSNRVQTPRVLHT